jgi:hypothetical protein
LVIIIDESQYFGLQVLDGKKRATLEHLAHQNATFAFDAQLLHDATTLGNPTDQRLGLMDKV